MLKPSKGSDTEYARFEDALLARHVGATGQNGVVLLHRVAVLIGDAAADRQDVRAVGLSQRLEADVAVQAVAGFYRLEQFEALFDLDDLLVGDGDVQVLEEG